MENLLKTLRNCPNTLEYLTPDPESNLSYDIDELSKGLPVLMTSIDTASCDELKSFALSVSWVIVHLRKIRDEIGGE